VNFLAGSPLNRLSWLRPNHTFLNAVLASPSTRWILFNAGQPLMVTFKSETNSKKCSLANLTTADVRPLLGSEPFFGQGEHSDGKVVTASTDDSPLGSARHRGAPIVFLGLQETCSATASALPSSDFKDAKTAVANLEGTPFFALDVSHLESIESVEELLLKSVSKQNGDTELAFMDTHAAMRSFDAITAGIFAEARSLVDWNQRNKVSFFNFSSEIRSGKTGLGFIPFSSVQVVEHLRTPFGEDGSSRARRCYHGLITQVGRLVQQGQFPSVSRV
jgi:NAD+ diphosphatase